MSKNIYICADGDMTLRDLLRKHISTAQIKTLKYKGKILLNDKIIFARDRVKNGDNILLIFPDEEIKGYFSKDLDIKIVYEDDDYLVIDKGRGIACIPNQRGMDNIFEGLNFLGYSDNYHVITRLDKDTQGLVLLAKNSLAASKIDNIQKKYYAYVEGCISEPFVIDQPIVRTDDIKRCVSSDGKKAVTIVTPVRCYENTSLVECELVTGRTHQIRVHLSYVGHPIVGDTLYGNGQGEYNSGQRLLCHYLLFLQPFTQNSIRVYSKREI